MSRAETVKLVLIRSGLTDWECTERLQGVTDLPLSQLGREALQGRAAEWAAGGGMPKRVEAVFTGPDEASFETGGIVAAALGRGAKVRRVPELAELDLGLWEGLMMSDFEERFPRAYRQWWEDPGSVTPPAGEPLVQGRDRIIGAITRLLSRNRWAALTEGLTGGLAGGSPDHIALVLRPLALGIARCWLSGAPSSRLWDLALEGPAADTYTLLRDGTVLTPAADPAPERVGSVA